MLGNLKYAPGIAISEELILNNIEINNSLLAANVEVKEGINIPISARLKPEATIIVI
jgi:hypothetical protein